MAEPRDDLDTASKGLVVYHRRLNRLLVSAVVFSLFCFVVSISLDMISADIDVYRDTLTLIAAVIMSSAMISFVLAVSRSRLTWALAILGGFCMTFAEIFNFLDEFIVALAVAPSDASVINWANADQLLFGIGVLMFMSTFFNFALQLSHGRALLSVNQAALTREIEKRSQTEALLKREREHLIQLASGAPVDEVLRRITGLAETVIPGAWACVIPTSPERFGFPAIAARQEELARTLASQSGRTLHPAPIRGGLHLSPQLAAPGSPEHTAGLNAGLWNAINGPVNTAYGDFVLLFRDPPQAVDESTLRMLLSLAALALGKAQLEAERDRFQSEIAEARHLERLNVLTGAIAHDFNNLLMGIQGNLELMRFDAGSNDDILRAIDLIESCVERTAELTDQMLVYSGQTHFHNQQVLLEPLLQDLAGDFRLSLLSGQTLDLEITGNLPPIPGDLAQLRQLFLNLLSNAREALGRASGVIVVRLAPHEADTACQRGVTVGVKRLNVSYAEITVTDSGQGIPESSLEKIFEPFFSTKFMGRGLGLAAVAGIIRGHHGLVQVSSTEGEGTGVRVLLPLVEVAETTRTAPPQSTAPFVSARPAILLFQPDVEHATAVTRTLRRAGHPILAARTPEDAREILRDHGATIGVVIHYQDGADHTPGMTFRLADGVQLPLITIGDLHLPPGNGSDDVTTLPSACSPEQLLLAVENVLGAPGHA